MHKVEAGSELLTERLLRVVDEGRRVATYKLALLLALIDLVGSRPNVNEFGTRDIAEEVLRIYYPQTRVFVAADGIERELRQITAKGSVPLRAALKLRLHGDGSGCRSSDDARERHPVEYEEAVEKIEDTFVREPIPRLQTVGRESIPFLYDVTWAEGVSVKSLRRLGADRVQLLQGVSEGLVRLGPLIRPLIELHWTRDVARWTGLANDSEILREHLFGSPRIAIPRVLRSGLRELQLGDCFYCGSRLGERFEIDHFLARSRWPNDAIENLVAADSCNSHKSDHFAAETHVQKWSNRVLKERHELEQIAVEAGWPSAWQRTTGLVVNSYRTLVPGTPLWVLGGSFEQALGPLDLRLHRAS